MTSTTLNGPLGEFYLIMIQRRYLLVPLEWMGRMFANKGSFDWITIVDSLKVIPFSCGEKILRRTSPSWILKLDLINENFRSIFFDRQNPNGSINVFV